MSIPRRLSELYNNTAPEARALVEESDEMRQRYFQAVTGPGWMCAADYDLAIDTSLPPLDEIAEFIIQILRRRKIVT